MKKILLLVLAIGFSQMAYAQQYVINGNITGFPNGTKVYLKDIDVDSNIDSTVIQSNQFVLKGKIFETPKSLWLYALVNKHFYYTTLLIGNDKLKIAGDIKDFPFDLSITGSKTQDEHNVVTNFTKANYKRRNELLDEYFALKGDSAKIKSKVIWKKIGKIDSTDDANRKTYVASHINSYEALFQLFYLKAKFPKDSLQHMYNSLTTTFKQSNFGQRIGNYLKVGDILKKGDQMTDFGAMDKDGNKHRLADMKGKYILLDFSTTYCGPCMQSIVDLKKIEAQYKDQLNIITFSGDGGKATWLEGVNRDKPNWLSLWDGKGNFGETILKYGVSGYPTFFMIDPDGKIVGKWVGYGKEDNGKGSLETQVDGVFAKK